jgi:hypothetical protein
MEYTNYTVARRRRKARAKKEKKIEEEAYERRKIHQKHIKLKSVPIVSHTPIPVCIISQISSFSLSLGVLIPVFFHFLSIIFLSYKQSIHPPLFVHVSLLLFVPFFSLLLFILSSINTTGLSIDFKRQNTLQTEQNRTLAARKFPQGASTSCFHQSEAPSLNRR